jgi:hypothetical protein
MMTGRGRQAAGLETKVRNSERLAERIASRTALAHECMAPFGCGSTWPMFGQRTTPRRGSF